MLVVAVRPQHDELFVDEEGRRPVALSFRGAREGEANGPDAIFCGEPWHRASNYRRKRTSSELESRSLVVARLDSLSDLNA
jgi:hypothetical protein